MKRSWGLIGVGDMSYKMAFALGSRLHAVRSSNEETAQRFAKDFGLPKVYTSLEKFFLDTDMRIVYLPTPNHTHKDLCLQALKAGKHVLCEKPLATTVAEVDEIAKAAKSSNHVVMEGMWSRFLPIYKQIADICEDGVIGEPQRWEVKLGHQVPYSDESRFYSKEGGGVLLDLAVYPLAIANYLFGPQEHVATRGTTATNGVDNEAFVTVKNQGGLEGKVDVSFRHGLPEIMTIYGEWGRIDISGPAYRPTSYRIHRYYSVSSAFEPGKKLGIKAKIQNAPWLHGLKRSLKRMKGRVSESDEIHVGYKGDGYIHEILAMENAVEQGGYEVSDWPLSASRNVIEVLEKSRATLVKP